MDGSFAALMVYSLIACDCINPPCWAEGLTTKCSVNASQAPRCAPALEDIAAEDISK